MALDFTKASGNKTLNAVAKTSKYSSNKTEVFDIPMSLIDENEDNEKIFNMEKIDSLAKAIGEEGWTGAIEVIARPNGRYEISSGHRRFRAMQKLGKETIPCIIMHDVDARAKAKKLISSNIHNRELTPLDWGRAIKYYAEHVSEQGEINKISRRECVEFFGFTETTISRYLALTNLTPALQKLATTEGFPVSALSPASRLDAKAQDQLAKEIEEHLSELIADTESNVIPTDDEYSEEEPYTDYSLISKDFVVSKIAEYRGGQQIRATSAKKKRLVPEGHKTQPEQKQEAPAPKASPAFATPLEVGEVFLSFLCVLEDKETLDSKTLDVLTEIRDELNRLL